MRVFGAGRTVALALGILTMSLVTGHIADAQDVVVSGVVADTNGIPIDSAEVIIASLRMKTRSGADGSFRFPNVPPGEYDVRARRLGFLPQLRKIRVNAENVVITYALLPLAQLMPVTIVTSSRAGLSGVVGDSSYRALEGAEVRLLSANASAKTDSLGAFHLDVKPGVYMLRVELAGYMSRMVGVTIPNDSGRRVTVILPPQQGNGVLLANAAMDMQHRVNSRNVVHSRLYSREDIERMGFEELSEMYERNAPRRVSDRCMALVNGGPLKVPIWSIKAENLEYVEVYWKKPSSYAVTSIMTKPKTGVPAAPDACEDVVVAWLKR